MLGACSPCNKYDRCWFQELVAALVTASGRILFSRCDAKLETQEPEPRLERGRNGLRPRQIAFPRRLPTRHRCRSNKIRKKEESARGAGCALQDHDEATSYWSRLFSWQKGFRGPTSADAFVDS